MNYKAIFDNNILLGAPPISEEVTALIETYRGHPDITLEVYVPEIVKEEFKHHTKKNILAAKGGYYNNTKALSSVMGISFPPHKLIFSDTQMLKKAEQIISKLGIAILPTPKIGLKILLKRAVNHEPPFQANGDRGLKDTIIYLTLLTELPKWNAVDRVAFVCNDKGLSETANELAKKFPNFKVYKSVEELQSDINLHLIPKIKNDQESIDKLSDDAEKIFYSKQDDESLFYKSDVIKRLNNNFPSLFANPTPQPFPASWFNSFATDANQRWIPTDEPIYDIYRPVFLSVNDERVYRWQTTVIYRQSFEFRQNTFSGTVGHIAQQGKYELEFVIYWQALITHEGKLDKKSAEIVKAEYKDTPSQSGWASVFPSILSGPTTISGSVTFVDGTKSEI